MLKKNIKFEDHEGNELAEDFYFNMTKDELTELALANDGFDKILEDLGKSENGIDAYRLFRRVVLMSYGKKGEDGVSFDKYDEKGIPLSRRFESHPAFSELIVDLIRDEQQALAFVQGLFPAKYRDEIAKAVEEQEAGKSEGADNTPVLAPVAPVLTDDKPAKFEDFSDEELLSMSRETFDALLPKESGGMNQKQLQIAMMRRSKGL